MSSPETKSPYPLYDDKMRQVSRGEYRIISGNDKPVNFDPERFESFPDPTYNAKPGIAFRGFYAFENNSSASVHSFLYHKLDTDGVLEAAERVVIRRGIGYGEHPGHVGQPPTWYIIGCQIGTYVQESGELSLVGATDLIEPKHFSVACITDGPLGDPILANPIQV